MNIQYTISNSGIIDKPVTNYFVYKHKQLFAIELYSYNNNGAHVYQLKNHQYTCITAVKWTIIIHLTQYN